MQAGLGKYCMTLLADYITAAAAPPVITDTASSNTFVQTGQSLHGIEALTGQPAAALRQGALALYGACSPAEVGFLLCYIVCNSCETTKENQSCPLL